MKDLILNYLIYNFFCQNKLKNEMLFFRQLIYKSIFIFDNLNDNNKLLESQFENSIPPDMKNNS